MREEIININKVGNERQTFISFACSGVLIIREVHVYCSITGVKKREITFYEAVINTHHNINPLLLVKCPKGRGDVALYVFVYGSLFD